MDMTSPLLGGNSTQPSYREAEQRANSKVSNLRCRREVTAAAPANDIVSVEGLCALDASMMDCFNGSATSALGARKLAILDDCSTSPARSKSWQMMKAGSNSSRKECMTAMSVIRICMYSMYRSSGFVAPMPPSALPLQAK